MSLPLSPLTFYRMPDASPAASTIAGLLDAIYTSMTSATDYRGTALPASHLWTINRQVSGSTLAVYMTAPAGTTMGQAPGLIIAGSSGAPTPTMASPDSFTASNVLIGINKNVGAWNAWDAAGPFTSGQFSGYWRACSTTWNSTSAIARPYISEEAIIVQLIGATPTQQAWFGLGANVEPHVSYADSVGLDAEADDRLYGMWASGATGNLTAAWLNGNGTATPFTHATGAGAAHMMVFQPGTGTLFACGRKQNFLVAGSTTEVTTSGGAYVGDLMGVCRSTATLTPDGARLGMARNMYPIGKITTGRTIRNGGTDLYHVISVDTAAPADAMIVKAAP